MNKLISYIFFTFCCISCISTKSTIKNIANDAPNLKLKNSNTFLISEFSKDKKYGYEKDYPINLFYQNSESETLNAERFLNALAGPNHEKISYERLESCCPFPTNRNAMGAGFLSVYELKWEGQKKPVVLYLNIYEKGYLMVPVGLTLKKD